MSHFADRLTEANRRSGTVLCMGIDPHAAMIPALFGAATPGTDGGISALGDFTAACLEQALGRVAAIKPQAAFFEQYGPEGMVILASLAREAIAAGMLVVMDAKRGDIGSTSTAYAAGWLGHDAPFPSDALTINPWLGIDTLEPFLERADATQSGLFVLNRTSNPGAGALQDKLSDGLPIYHHLAGMLAPLAAERRGAHGWSSLGIVAGATWPEDARALRAILPDAPFLVPGFGAQGAGPEKALAGLHYGDHGWEGGLVNSTRGLIFPANAADAASISDWKDAIATAIDDSKTALNITP
ncbi:MAG: orotidine-5'-phosphate decarboxylase [Alphaproteobacteria bacterium]|jgi:orotidine-5'-phosphate decarboxylase